VEIDAQGCATVEQIPLRGARDLRRITGTLQELLDGPIQGDPQDFIVARLTDVGPVRNAIGRLRQVYPKVLHIERDAVAVRTPSEQTRTYVRTQSMEELFGLFFQDAMDREMHEAETSVMAEIIGPLQSGTK